VIDLRATPKAGKYAVILADPPWHHASRSAKGQTARSPSAKYPTMPLEEIKRLPVAAVAARDAHLFLWTTGPHLPQAFEVLAAWGFRYSSIAFLWAKLNPRASSSLFTPQDPCRRPPLRRRRLVDRLRARPARARPRDGAGLRQPLADGDRHPPPQPPEARHYVQDIATVRPHLLVPEGYLDLLMASPTCTHHSVARGGKPTSDQQRSDPWHIITWLTELRVKRLIIENVWEFTGWGPVDPKTGKPIKDAQGRVLLRLDRDAARLGFDPEWRKLNAADYGDATTRQRFILMARSDGRRSTGRRRPTPSGPDEGLALFPT
jgi:hypothetical protein